MGELRSHNNGYSVLFIVGIVGLFQVVVGFAVIPEQDKTFTYNFLMNDESVKLKMAVNVRRMANPQKN